MLRYKEKWKSKEETKEKSGPCYSWGPITPSILEAMLKKKKKKTISRNMAVVVIRWSTMLDGI